MAKPLIKLDFTTHRVEIYSTGSPMPLSEVPVGAPFVVDGPRCYNLWRVPSKDNQTLRSKGGCLWCRSVTTDSWGFMFEPDAVVRPVKHFTVTWN